MSLEVLYRSVQRGGNSGETLSSSDSPIMVAQACFTQEGAALPSKALAPPFSRRPSGLSLSRNHEREDLGEVGKPDPEGLSIKGLPLWAIGFIHGAGCVWFLGFGHLLTQVQVVGSPFGGPSPDCILAMVVNRGQHIFCAPCRMYRRALWRSLPSGSERLKSLLSRARWGSRPW